MKGYSYAIWDNVDKEFVSWSWTSFKKAKEEMMGYFNNQALRILKVKDGVIRHECNRFVDKPTTHRIVNITHAQSKLY